MDPTAKTPKVINRGIDEIWQRQFGMVRPRAFAQRIAGFEELVLRLDQYAKLEMHQGCVNTVHFNSSGDLLVSGSDDRLVILWDWDSQCVKLSFHSGHTNNVFQARIMPFSDDRSIVTCAADGQVRYAKILEGGQVDTVKLARHGGRAYKLAIERGSPHIFYSCGEDGLVQHFDLRTRMPTKLFTCTSFHDSHIVYLNAITIDPQNPNLFAIGGSDEYARLYDIRKCKWDGSSDNGHSTDSFCPPHLIGKGHVNITGLAFSNQSELLVSYNNELIYLFPKELGLGPEPGSASSSSMDKKNGPQVYKGHHNTDTVKGVNFFGPNCEYVVSGSDCGRIFIWKKKSGKLVRLMHGDKHVVNCIEPHPHATVLASSGLENNVKIWTPRATAPFSLPENLEELLNGRESLAHFATLREIIMHIFPSSERGTSRSRRRARGGEGDGEGEDDEEEEAVGEAELEQYIIGFADRDASDDDNGGNDDGDEHPGDCRVS
ncbi:DDB1- and CUL4-associated factor 8 [Amborella trichopoda]|uniref:Uncharacterized protein n=1 Tax=Amborella trichopoda TaxID=13333 RepID=W1NL95_AMBTC|nr:DDB1- and CUL4-associated factor 8 [Amborella trichopoda]ERM96241.1 hypothetical protein AMTR_s00001p00141440 [Amborella trichopoda]|eukprot:XP_006828825.1 DDB1- and CUL4-associated factor 8 [Amborella trichopoda]